MPNYFIPLEYPPGVYTLNHDRCHLIRVVLDTNRLKHGIPFFIPVPVGRNCVLCHLLEHHTANTMLLILF